MSFYAHQSYKDFAKMLEKSFKNNSNLLIVSVPGMSVTFYIKSFLEKNKNADYKYITSESEPLARFNILDLNFDKNSKALITVDNYLKSAGLNQKFAVVINTPQVLQTGIFLKSFATSHFYDSFYFKPLDESLIKIFASIIKVDLSVDEIEKIYILSGGLTRVAKFLITHKSLIDGSAKSLLEDENLMRVFSPTVRIIEKCEDDTLLKLGIKRNGEFVGKVLQEYFKLHPKENKIDIDINSDLTFIEKGDFNNTHLLKVEKFILEEVLSNNGVITKEKIADFKWGQGSYDKYSDQAIAKTIFRLKNKLHKYTIVPIPGYGYKFIEK